MTPGLFEFLLEIAVEGSLFFGDLFEDDEEDKAKKNNEDDDD